MTPVIHVGFHKSGSTTLKDAFFARHPGIASLGEPEEDFCALQAVRNVWESSGTGTHFAQATSGRPSALSPLARLT